MALFGADVDQLRRLGTTFGQQAEALTAIAARLDTQIDNVQWHGPDAERFRSEWRSNHSVIIRKAAEALVTAGSTATTNASQQEQTSGGGGLDIGGIDPSLLVPGARGETLPSPLDPLDPGSLGRTMPYPVFPSDNPGSFLDPGGQRYTIEPFPFAPLPYVGPEAPGPGFVGVLPQEMWFARPSIEPETPFEGYSVLPFAPTEHAPVLDMPGLAGGLPVDGIGYTANGEPHGYVTQTGGNEWQLVRPDGSTDGLVGIDDGADFWKMNPDVSHVELPELRWVAPPSSTL